jgi:2-polyprenyl-3-methyl-5-hydroxy-6-metoxy-1,4-benzoquinol methylase
MNMDTYYSRGLEQNRLGSAVGEVERLRTESIMRRHLPPPPAVILDVGGAAGAYAFSLASNGYSVHLIDPVPLHIAQAKAHAIESGIHLQSIVEGDARSFSAPPAGADVALLFGPLYHLLQRKERIEALGHVRHALKPGGILFAAMISRYASFIDGLSRGFFADPIFRQIVNAGLACGQHANPTDSLDYFTDAYFHRPDEAREEIAESGFSDIRLMGIEGPAWGVDRFTAAMGDAVQRDDILRMLQEFEQEPSIVGASAHFLAIARK